MVEDGALSHKIDYVTNYIIGSKVMVILLNGWILPIDGVASGRVGACSLRSSLFINRHSKARESSTKDLG